MQRRHQAWGTAARAPWSLRMHANFEAVEVSKVYFVSTYRPITHIKALITVTVEDVAKNFSHIRFFRPNARRLLLLDDFVITNFGTRAPHVRPPPWSKILATPLHGRCFCLSLTIKSRHLRRQK